MASLGAYAKEKGIKYFLVSFVDLFGTMRAKIVPATAIDMIAKAGAGFAGFAIWFDMTPAASGHACDGGSGQRHSTAVEARSRAGSPATCSWAASRSHRIRARCSSR